MRIVKSGCRTCEYGARFLFVVLVSTDTSAILPQPVGRMKSMAIVPPRFRSRTAASSVISSSTSPRYPEVPPEAHANSVWLNDRMVPAARSRGGSAPDPTVRERVLEAFVDQVERHGLPNVSIEQVARQAGVSKVTLYKRWPTRRELVVDAYRLVSRAAPDLDEYETARGAFDAVFARADDSTRHLQMRQLTAELVAASEYDDVAQRVLFERQAMWRGFIREVIELGKRTGEIPADRDPDMVVDVVVSITTAGYLIRDRATGDMADLAWRVMTAERPF